MCLGWEVKVGTGEFAGIADVRDGVLVLLDEQVHDVVVADELACGGLHIGLQIADDRLFLGSSRKSVERGLDF